MTQPAEEITKRQFSIGPCLGKGGFGEVYRAKMSSAAGLESEVAVKVLRNDLDPAGQAVQRLRDEGRLLARLNHPTILRVHDLVLLEGCISLVTEYVEGEDLGACLVGKDPMPIRAQLEVLAGVAAALDAAWTTLGADGKPLQLVHRDIKPSNIRISRHGQVKLLDFGIARSDSMQREARTATNLMVGSPGYMAPERFLDAASIPASDVFALGCVLFEGIAGGERLFQDIPFPVQTGMAVHRDRFDKFMAKRWELIPASTPEPVKELLRQLLAYEPSDRPTASDLAHRCEELADQVPGASLSRWAKARKWPDASTETGPLVGRTLTEGTMTRQTLEATRQPTKPPPMTTWEENPRSGTAKRSPTSSDTGSAAKVGLAAAGGAVVMLGGVVLLVVAVIGGIAATSYMGTETTPEEVAEVAEPEPEPQPEPEVAPAEPPEEVVAEAPAEEPPPIEAAVVPAPPPEPAKASRTPRTTTTTTTAEKPPPAPASTAAKGTIAMSGGSDFVVEVAVGGKRVPTPAELAPGSYEVWYSFQGSAPVSLGNVSVGEGETKTVKCSPGFRKCTKP
jgi:serine/threonine protein kinase